MSVTKAPVHSNVYESLKRISYRNSQRSTMGKDRPKLTCEDYYVILEEASDYEEALHTYANMLGIPDYFNITDHEDVPNNNNTAENEEIFVDPGHCVTHMCACFEKKKHCLINESDIRLGLLL